MPESRSHECHEAMTMTDGVSLELTRDAADVKERARHEAMAGGIAPATQRFVREIETLRDAFGRRDVAPIPLSLQIVEHPDAVDASGEREGARQPLPKRLVEGFTITARSHADAETGWLRTVVIRSLLTDGDRRYREAKSLLDLLEQLGQCLDRYEPLLAGLGESGVVCGSLRAADDMTRTLLAIHDLVRPRRRFTWSDDGHVIENLEGARERAVPQCSDYPNLAVAGVQALDGLLDACVPNPADGATTSDEMPQEQSGETGVTRPLLVRQGEIWKAIYDDETVPLKNMKGLADLDRLLALPGVPIDSYALDDRKRPSDGRGDVVMDDAALRELRREYDDLDGIETDEAHERREDLLGEMKRAVGIHGRPRRLGSEDKRVAQAVSKRIRSAVAAIQRAHALLGAHLEASLSYGAECCYQPARDRSEGLTAEPGSDGAEA